MRIISIVVLLITLVFINLGDTLFSGSMGRFSQNTRNTLNQLVLKLSQPKDKETTEKVSEKSDKPKKTLTDEYFDRALEEAEKQTNAIE